VIRDLLHTQLRSRHLLAVARLTSARTTVELFSPSRARVAAVTHDDVIACDSMGRISRFGRVALTSAGPGGRTLLRSLIDAFTSAGCASAPRVNDLQLACGALSPPGPALCPPMPRRPRSAAMTDLVGPMLGTSLHRLLAHDLGVRVGSDPEAVHQLRVATRRLRADLRALRPVLDRARADHLRREVSWLGSLAGPVRDSDVLMERLTPAVATLPEDVRRDGRALIAVLVTQRRDRHDAVLAGMRTARYDALLDALVEAVAHPPVRAPGHARPDRRADAVFARAAARRWRELVEAVTRTGDPPGSAGLHRVRIAAKRVRYTAEAAAPVLGKHAVRLATLAERVQTTLGELHDAVVAEAWLNDAAIEPGLAVVAEQLSTAERAQVAELLAGWEPLWKKIRPEAERELRALTAR
jgi:CHAD domain-containing protein